MEKTNLDKTWNSILQALRTAISEGSFNTYLKNTRLTGLREVNDRVVGEVSCPSAFIKNTVEQRFWGQIAEELERVVGKKSEVEFKVETKIKDREIAEKSDLPLFETRKNTNDNWKRANLREDYTFENYAVGGSNQMAFAAAQAVSKKPGQAYNPLFIYGGVGVGKTHLMQAVGHEILQKSNGSVLFCSGEEFTNDLVEAIRLKSTEKVRTKYRKVTALLIDDVQFIAGKPSIQEEFFHTFNAITRDGGQIIMTSDKPPSEISKLEERLRSRFGAGLIVDIGVPDFELRSAILLIKAKQKNINLPMEAAQLIASKIEGVRELQGFLTRLMSESELNHREISLEMSEYLLKVPKANNGVAKIVTPTEVITIVANYYGIGIQLLKGDRRTKTIAWPRQILMYLLRNDLRLPLDEVGRLIGGRDHTTVIHADNKVKAQLEVDTRLKTELEEIKKQLFTLH